MAAAESDGSTGVAAASVTPRNLAPMLLLALMWGLSIPVTKLGLETLPPLTLTALRYAVAAPLLMVFCLGKPVPWRAFAQLAGLGALGIGFGQVAQTFGIAGTTASVGTIISAAIPLFVVLFAALRFRQKVTARQIAGLAAAFAGIACVAFGQGPEADPARQSTLMGAAWVLLSAVSIAFYFVWSVELSRTLGTMTVMAWSTLFGLLALVPWTLWELRAGPVAVTAEGFAAAVYLGAIVSVAGLYLWLHILRTVAAPVAAAVQYLQPVIGIGAAALMFGDRLGVLFAAGVVLILGGVALAAARKAR